VTRPRYVRLQGARFAAVTEAEAVLRIVDAAANRCGHWTITANLDHLRRYRREPLVRQMIEEADLVVADGMPLIWASRLAGVPLPERVAGSDMTWSISQAASSRNLSIFLLGGDPGVADRAAQVLQDRFEGLEVAGTLCPPMGFEHDALELERIQERMIETAPRIVFVGLGFPKQDLLITRLRNALPGTSFIGVGISLSYVAGREQRAPGWTQKLGLEWVYRLVCEPRRLARRYLLEGLPFAVELFSSAALCRLRSGAAPAQWGRDHDA
jgi:N-acetylglucosaminyldiphosphoundecaprenol N-acetyl-beta-D-mannosaminyltransferase